MTSSIKLYILTLKNGLELNTRLSGRYQWTARRKKGKKTTFISSISHLTFHPLVIPITKSDNSRDTYPTQINNFLNRFHRTRKISPNNLRRSAVNWIQSTHLKITPAQYPRQQPRRQWIGPKKLRKFQF